MKHAAVIAALLALGGCGDGGRGASVEERPLEITKGAATTGELAVVAIVTTPPSCGPAASTATCTGTLIAPRAVLTAGHCVDDQAASVVDFGATVGAPGTERRRVIAAARHPQYSRDDSAHDLAILWLDAPSSFTPVALPPSSAAPAPGDTVVFVGFGQTRDPAEPEGVRRTGTARLTAATERTLTYSAAPSMTCQGDSGGPVFTVEGGEERLVGVISAGDRDCREAGTAARLDAALDEFVLPTLAAPPLGEAGTPLSCEGNCARDVDCRPGLVCRQARDGANRCAISGFEPGELGVACARDVDCGEGNACATTFEGCRCYTPCAGPDAPEAVEGPDPKRAQTSTAPAPEWEGGCAAGRGPGRGRDAAWLLLALTGARRRRRLSRRAIWPTSRP